MFSKTLRGIIKKEFYHILRDRQTLIILFLMPVLMLFLYGYAITMEMRQIETAIINLSHSQKSRSFIEKIVSNDFFKVTAVDVPYEKLESVFQKRQARAIIIFPQNFADDLNSNPHTKVQLLIDASDPNAANFINNYLNVIAAKYNLAQNASLIFPFSVEPRLLYNPDLKSVYFFVPGLIALILLLICALLTSIAIVREKESGTLEQILVSPVKPLQIIIGKVIPYLVISYLMGVMILIFGYFWFDVPINGSLLLLNIMLLLYIFTGLSIGLLVSTIARTQQIAMMVTLVATILPTVMISGFIFPIASMPEILQWVAKIIPATHFLEIIRGIMLKGVGIKELYNQTLFLVGLSLFLTFVSMRKFKTHLE
ncbi:MAG: ABC transporter permease [Calditrichaeota bacterium]|nr:MAG: ABC transporter permease [Calditrichota bacterium]MBL1206161.1 ABC transporter permease [Calditrichota bacterium]NOG45986.1 ABC transporter permease [Calditrichota bacterium]